MDPTERIENVPESETDSLPAPTEFKSESEADAKLISKIFGNKNKNDELAPDGQSMDEEEYRMDHTRRGKVIIFNHWKYKENVKERAGATVDQNRLDLEFRSLGFETDICENYTVQQLKDKLAKVAEEDHSDADCLAVVVMSHGRSGEIHAFDGIYREKELWNHFTGDKCPQLRGKPKLFFIQACRGDLTDDGSKLKVSATQRDGRPEKSATYTIPNTADLLIAHATYDGYYAWRNADDGSWFIQALCQELSQNGKKYDILRLMTNVNRRVAFVYKSYTPANKDMDQKKQMSTVLSTLTRLLYFKPKTSKNSNETSL